MNSGYDNLNLKYKLIEDSFSKLNVHLAFPDGKNLGITRNKLRVEVTFSSKKPVSFTSRLEFYDDQDRCYDLTVSGTADNCMLTCAPYFQRSEGEYKIELEHDRAPIRLESGDGEDDDDDDDQNGGDENPTSGITSPA